MDPETNPAAHIEPGMLVETTRGDLGEGDISKAEVAGVIEDETGKIEGIVVTKGTIFRKEIEIEVARITRVEEPGEEGDSGRVVISASSDEVDSLAASGTEHITQHRRTGDNARGSLLQNVERAVPTEVGLRTLEAASTASSAGAGKPSASSDTPRQALLGPGFLAGISGKDASAVTTYAVDGARLAYGHLWLMLVATPLLQAVQFACARIGRIQQKGLAYILREHYGLRIAVPAALLLVIANTGMIAANLVAVGSGLELLTGVGWAWFIVPVAAALWYITVYQNFESFKRVFLLMSLVFLTYIVTAVLARPDWSALVAGTFVPTLDFSMASISGAVGLLGATISPYTIFWQVQGETEEKRPGPIRNQLRLAGIDIAAGVVSSNLVAYSIIVSSAATLYAGHQEIATALDVARSFEPLVGAAGKYLFALGLIGAGLIAIPILLASTSYAVAGTVGWPAGLSKKPWQSEGFYLIFTAALVAGLIAAVIGFDPIQLMFWANVLQGVLSPLLILVLIAVGNNRRIMRGTRLNIATNTGLVLTAVIMSVGAGLLLYGLATG
ncbi:MAG TPA: divalent metal cation transporter [Chloroflexia bacterium]|nr:divalent metal cation transporter [Chloroflexia bacterium]